MALAPGLGLEQVLEPVLEQVLALVLELGLGLGLEQVLAPGLEQVLAPVLELGLGLGSQQLTSSRPTIMSAELTVFSYSSIYLLKGLRLATSQPTYTIISTTPLSIFYWICLLN